MSAVTRLVLGDFRSYPTLDLRIAGRSVALAGDNGAGKTNILEALSLFSPGRGLRRAAFAEMARLAGNGGFAVSVEIDAADGPRQLGHGWQPGEAGRRCRIDRAEAGSAAAFAEFLRPVWMTPEHDGLFRGPAGDRRRFLDRLVLAVDSAHVTRVTAMEKAFRQRNRLLEDERPDARWLGAIEREAAELAVAVTAARLETVSRLRQLIETRRDALAPFPWADVTLSGDLERALGAASAAEAEGWYAAELERNRWRDRAAGRATVGPSASDLAVRHGPKDMPAEAASTGEQKSLLIGLFLAQAELVRAMSGLAPTLLLDEVAAHLDGARRRALYAALARLSAQVWLTGTDVAFFEGFEGEILSVTGNRVSATG